MRTVLEGEAAHSGRGPSPATPTVEPRGRPDRLRCLRVSSTSAIVDDRVEPEIERSASDAPRVSAPPRIPRRDGVPISRKGCEAEQERDGPPAGGKGRQRHRCWPRTRTQRHPPSTMGYLLGGPRRRPTRIDGGHGAQRHIDGASHLGVGLPCRAVAARKLRMRDCQPSSLWRAGPDPVPTLQWSIGNRSARFDGRSS